MQDDGTEPPRKRARPSETAPPGPPTHSDGHDGVSWGSATEPATEAGRKRARSPGGEDGPQPRRRRQGGREGGDASESMAVDGPHDDVDSGNQVGPAAGLPSVFDSCSCATFTFMSLCLSILFLPSSSCV